MAVTDLNNTGTSRDKKEVRIHIGDFYTSSAAIVISTLLGSCVAACLYDKDNRVAGMNHILLPGKTDLKRFDQRSRYSINAMEMLINDMMKKGAERHKLKAKIFGGANVLPFIVKQDCIGPKISQFVIDFLKMEGIPVIARDTGGLYPRKVYYHTGSGEVYVKKLRYKGLYSLYRLEANRLKEIEQKINEPGDVTFF